MYDIEKIWPKWKIVRVLGEGSFGKVYEICRNEFGIEERSALKVVSIPQSSGEVQSLRNDGMTDRDTTEYFKGVVMDFVKEIQLMSQLKGHSNIVAYEDFEVIEKTDSIGFEILIRMELLTAFPKYLRENPFRVVDVVQLGIDLCKALEVCRELNIIHRDIKPDNIFVSATGSFKLGDFGVARTVEQTGAGMSRKGTYSYMAPEIYNGKEYGFEADIYSLGIVLYKLLNNNRDPFLPDYPAPVKYDDKMQALMKRLQGESLPRPGNADDKLTAVIFKACAYDPAMRYSHPSQFREELEEIVSCYQKLDSEVFAENGISYYTNQSLFTFEQSAPPVQDPPQEEQPAERNTVTRCTACGAELKPGAKFCGKCGQLQEQPMTEEQPIVQEQPVPEAQPMRQDQSVVCEQQIVYAQQPLQEQKLLCTTCGAELKVGAKFCGKCGMKQEVMAAQENVARCIVCGAELKPGAKFCGKCGQVQEQPVGQVQTTLCYVCGAELKPGAKFCGKCGNKV